MEISLGSVVNQQVIRGCDGAGCGHYGASRKRKNKSTGAIQSVPNAHKGIDVVSSPGQQVLAPIDGVIVKLGYAYGNDHRFRTIHINGEGEERAIKVIIMYVTTTLTLGTHVRRGDPIGITQDLRLKYKSITNHLHIEVYYGGIVQDPTNLFNNNEVQQNGTETQVEGEVASFDESDVLGDNSLDVDETRLYTSTYDVPTIQALRETPDLIDIIITDEQLLEVTIEGKTNNERLYDNLSIEQKRASNNDQVEYNKDVNYPITIGAQIYIPINAYDFPYSYESNITVTKTIAPEYFPSILKQLTTDPGYVRAEKNRGNVTQNIFPQLTVWIWSRNKYMSDPQSMGWMDVSSHIISCNTDSDISSVGGNFSLELAPINASVNKTSKGVHFSELGKYSDHASLASSTEPNLFITYGKNREIGAETIRKRMYYESILFTNDLVFISFEKLKIDGVLSPEEVGNKWYDFQGMIDVVETDVTGEGNDVKITVRGRDFSKVMMEDNSYFNPFSIGHINSIYGGTQGSRFLRGEFKEISAVLAQTIQQRIEFIVSRIASINYVPNDIFQGFANLTEITAYSDQVNPVKGIWQLFKVFIDSNIRDLRLVDDSITNPNGTILDLMQKTAQSPFVEFFADTYGDKYYLIFRQPPFTQKALNDLDVSLIEGVDEDFIQYATATNSSSGSADFTVNRYLEYTNEFYERMRSAKNTSDKKRLSTQQSLPLVEESFEDGGSGQVTISTGRSIFPCVINISELDVLSDSLRYSNESYSWYKLTDRGNFAGQSVGLGEIQSVYFDEMAQVFGNKLMEVTSNYSDYKFFLSKDTESDKNKYAEQASQLLTFLVETSIYLPFTRTGSITINRDRRIKKGQWIYYRPTQEFYYVDSVSHNSSIAKETIDAVTIIQVSRGMYKRFVSPHTVVDEETQEEYEVSYFNLVDLQALKQNIYDTVAGNNVSDKFDYKQNIGINSKVFNFFLQKRQTIQNERENGYF